MNKKFIASLLLCASLFSVVPAQAAVTSKTKQPKVIEYTTSDKANLYKYGIASNYSSRGISLDRYDDDPSDATIIQGPIYRTYQNSEYKYAAQIIIAYFTSKIPKTNFFVNWVITKLSGFTESIGPTYVGSWMWTSKGREYVTLVHYSDPDHLDPEDVQIIDVTDY